MDQYKLIVQVDGAKSGSDKLAKQQGVPVERTEQLQSSQPTSTPVDRIQQTRNIDIVNTSKKVVGGATAAGFVALDFYQQDRGFAGDSNRNLRINEIKRVGTALGVTTTLLATGNFIGAGLYVGYTALQLAKENRELLNAKEIDTYRSQYYSERLVSDTTQRSR